MKSRLFKSDALVARKFREFLLPSLLSTMAGQLGIVIDSMMVGNFISPDAMTGVSVCMPLEQAIGAVVMLLSVGAAAMIAVAAGARETEKANRIFTTVLFLNALVSALILLFTVPFLNNVAHFLSGQEAVTPLAYQYLQIMIWRTPFTMLLYALSILINSDGMVKLVGQGTVLAQVVNIGLDLLFIKVLNMGILGASIATVAGDIAALAFIILIYARSKQRTLHFAPFLKGFLSNTMELVRTGLPVAMATVLVSVRVWCVYHILEQAGGLSAMVIYSVCINLLTIMSMVGQGSQQAMLPVLGVIYGEKDYLGVRMLVRYVMRFILVLGGIFVAVTLIFPQFVLGLFNLSPEQIISGEMGVRIFSVSILGVLINFRMMYYYTAIDRMLPAAIISVVEGLLVIPVAWLLVRFSGTDSVWYAFLISEIVCFVVLEIYVLFMRRKDPGNCPDLYLIPTTLRELLYDVSIKACSDTATALSEDAIKILKDCGIQDNVATKAGIALEEITINLATRQNGRPPDLDVRIIRNGDRITLSLRDNGLPFDPMVYSVEDKEEYLTDGIMLFKAVAHNVKYSRVLSLNQTIVDI